MEELEHIVTIVSFKEFEDLINKVGNDELTIMQLIDAIAQTRPVTGFANSLEDRTIRQLIRSPGMRESTMYQSILREGRTAGEKSLVLKQLTRKLGTLSPEVTTKVSALSIERLESLGEALLDFTSIADLESWLG